MQWRIIASTEKKNQDRNHPFKTIATIMPAPTFDWFRI
jgi:hypothetical protein